MFNNNDELKKELERETKKLDLLIYRAMHMPIKKNVAIIKQGRKVRELINQIETKGK